MVIVWVLIWGGVVLLMVVMRISVLLGIWRVLHMRILGSRSPGRGAVVVLRRCIPPRVSGRVISLLMVVPTATIFSIHLATSPSRVSIIAGRWFITRVTPALSS